MARKSQSLSIVRDERKPLSDSPEAFARKCRHLSINGQPLESKLFRLRAEKDSDPLRGAS